MEHKNQQTNIGLQLLRMVLCFWIIAVHITTKVNNKNLYSYLYLKHFHVPCFMFLTFYFYYKHLRMLNIYKIIYRFKRLLIPTLIWPLIFLIINNLCFKLYRISIYEKTLSLKHYFYQIIGIIYYAGSFWYLEVVLFISLFFTICAFLFPNNFLPVIQLFGVGVYRLHRSNIYNYLQKQYFCKFILIAIIRMIPIAIAGLSFGSLNLIP